MKTDDRLIYLLAKAHHRIGNHLKKTLVAQNIKITFPQAGILFLLKRRSHSMTELSKELSIDNSAITGLVDRLEKVGFVIRESNLADRRTFLISLTPKGLEEINKAKVIVRKVNEDIKKGFTEQEIEIFKKILTGFFDKF